MVYSRAKAIYSSSTGRAVTTLLLPFSVVVSVLKVADLRNAVCYGIQFYSLGVVTYEEDCIYLC